MASVPRGRFVWYELMTTDPDAATRFYADVAEWQSEPWPDSPEPYTILLNGQRPLGGVMALPEPARAAGAPPAWIAYVSTPNTDETVEDARARGAQLVHGPMDVPTVGRMAILSDPQGAALAVYTPEGDTPGHGGPPVYGDFSWHELATTDPDAAWGFYTELFDWTSTGDFDMGEMGLYRMFGQNDMPYGGIYIKPADMPAPSHWLLYIKVSDLDAALDRVRAGGGQVINGPMEVPGGDHVAQCMDPQGAMFALHEAASAA